MKSLGRAELDLLREVCVSDVDQQAARAILTRCDDAAYFVAHCRTAKLGVAVLHEISNGSSAYEGAFIEQAKTELSKLYRDLWLPKQHRVLKALEMVRDILSDAKVPFAFIRGPAIAEGYYHRRSERLYFDLDVLVPKDSRGCAETVLLDHGFLHVETLKVREARACLMGQMEFHGSAELCPLDLNWEMSGNAGIGSVFAPVDIIWQRAKPYRGSEYTLSDEDILGDLIRHFGHGHDFSSGLLRTCVDTHMCLQSCYESIDWDYFQDQAIKAEYARVCALYAWFYDSVFCRQDAPRLGPHLRRIVSCHKAFGRRLFASLVLCPQIKLATRHNGRVEIVRNNLSFLAKLWSLDTVKRLLKLCRIVAWPANAELSLMSRTMGEMSIPTQRVLVWIQMILVTPGIVCGCFLRLMVAVLHRK